TVRFESLDPATRTAEIVARGQDTSGRGGADMRMKSRVAQRGPGESEVSVLSEVNVTGVMAQFGRGLMQDVSDQMLQKFTEAMRAELERPGTEPPRQTPESAPIEVLSFGSKLLFRRPAFWIAVAVLILLGFLWKWMD